MAITTGAFRGELQPGLTLREEQGGQDLFEKIKKLMRYQLEEDGVPAILSEDAVKSGGIFGTKCPILIITHPDSSCRYFSIGIYVIGNEMYFPLLGESAENTKANKKQYYLENGNHIRAALINPDEFKLQQERSWQRRVIESFGKIYE